MKTALAIRHLSFEDLGTFEAILLERGYRVRYLEAGIDDLTQDQLFKADLVFILGGPIGANDEADFPFISDELNLLKARIQDDLPTMGICLGAQLMARALGARVYPGIAKEIGWKPLQLTEAGSRSCIQYLEADSSSMLHWHGDTFDLPEGAVLLASTDICQNQIFTYGKRAIGFQCHPEVRAKLLEQWFIGHIGEIASQGLSVKHLRADSQKLGEVLQQQSKLFLNAWLDEVAY